MLLYLGIFATPTSDAVDQRAVRLNLGRCTTGRAVCTLIPIPGVAVSSLLLISTMREIPHPAFN